MGDFHARTMDIQGKPASMIVGSVSAYHQGYKEARRKAAEIALEADAEITALHTRIAALETQVKQARADALDEAAKLCWKQHKRRTDQCNLNVSDIQRARWVAGAMQSEDLAQAILALKETTNDSE